MKELKLTKAELPYTIAMIVLDIVAPICLLFGLSATTAANASLLNNFEDVASLRFSYGSLFVLLAAICWGFENNCTRKISSKDPLQILLLKGTFSGIGSLIIGLCIGERIEALWSIVAVLCVGFVAYGLSIFLCICTEVTWCSTDKCLLCRRSIYSGNSFFDYLSRNTYYYLFCCTCVNDCRCLAFFAR